MSLNRQGGRGVASGGKVEDRREREDSPHASVVKVIEVLAESDVSWEDAAARALEAASRKIRNIKSIYVSEQQAIVAGERIVGFRLNAKISFAVEDHEQEAHVARGGARRTQREEKSFTGERAMPNRDYEDSQYNRDEGRFGQREDWRDQSNTGSREWDRRGDDFRQGEYQSGARSGQRGSSYDQSRSGSPSYGSFDRDRDQRYSQPDWSRSPYYGSSSYDQDSRQREGNYAQDWRGQDYRSQSRFGQDYRSGQDHRYGQGYGQDYRSGQERGQHNFNQDWRTQGFQQDWRNQSGSNYGQDYRSQQSGYGQDWSRSQGFSPDYSRSQSNYGARDASRTSGYGGGNVGPFGNRQSWGGQREDRDEESWGEQIRHAGQQVARTVKRAFRGPKGYKRSDDRIREDVSDRLGMQSEIDPSEIEVSVSNGEVTLTGTVQSRHEKFLAEEIADDVSGVGEVHNQLRVRREEMGTSASTSSGTTTTTGQESALRNRNARA